MTDQLKNQLANALNIPAADIRDMRAARDGGYNIVLLNYQKFRNVEPLEAERPELIPVEQLPLARDVAVPGTEMYIPEELQKAYGNPKRASVVILKKL